MNSADGNSGESQRADSYIADALHTSTAVDEFLKMLKWKFLCCCGVAHGENSPWTLLSYQGQAHFSRYSEGGAATK